MGNSNYIVIIKFLLFSHLFMTCIYILEHWQQVVLTYSFNRYMHVILNLCPNILALDEPQIKIKRIL